MKVLIGNAEVSALEAITIIFSMGMCGFITAGTVVAGITGNDNLGYIAGVFGFAIMLINTYYLGKMNHAHSKEQELGKTNIKLEV